MRSILSLVLVLLLAGILALMRMRTARRKNICTARDLLRMMRDPATQQDCDDLAHYFETQVNECRSSDDQLTRSNERYKMQCVVTPLLLLVEEAELLHGFYQKRMRQSEAFALQYRKRAFDIAAHRHL